MKHAKPRPHRRIRLMLAALGALLAGAALIGFSMWLRPAPPQRPAPIVGATAPASAPSTPPAPAARDDAARNLSGMILLLGLAGLLVAVVFVILLVVDIRNARPAWQTQQRYPRKRAR